MGIFKQRGCVRCSDIFQPSQQSIIIILSSMRLQKIGSFSSSEHEESARMTSPGLLTRKPEKKAPFARKKAIECAHPEPKFSPFTSRLSREKRSPRPDALPTSTSLKIINSHLPEEIKYLSPKHAQSSLLVAATAKDLPLLRGQSEIQQQRSSSPSVLPAFEDMVSSDYTHTPSGISIQSLAGKSYAVETAEHSGDWFGLEGENERLREENRKLEEEVSQLRQELEEKPFSKKCPKCRHFDALERLKAEKAGQQRALSAHRNQVGVLKAAIEDLQRDLKEERQTVVLLSRELDASRQAEEQMDALVCSLKEKIESDTLELRYLNIQQDVLRRRKEEYERARAEGIKKDFERDSMRRVLNEYKQKVDLLRKVISKGRKEKKVLSKTEEIEISLELSMDSIL